jgi:hypothetical protein
MTVQHVHIADGGQAIVGNVNSPALGDGAQGKTRGQSHAISDARSAAMLCEIETERAAVPRGGRPRS